MSDSLREFLDRKVDAYNQPFFMEGDPLSIPHLFQRLPDREIAGFFAAIFAWGQRTTIIRKSRELMALMDDAPYDFIRHHQPADLKRLLGFRHRTFQPTDLLYCIEFLRGHYEKHDSLEAAFTAGWSPEHPHVGPALDGFHDLFFSLPDAPERTRKHIAAPRRGSTCKRLNMFLRWMVRSDDRGVDLGCWKHIRPDQLVMPLDLHVIRVARRFGLLQRKPADWTAALELTERLKAFDPKDPVKYDFALFGLGVLEKY